VGCGDEAILLKLLSIASGAAELKGHQCIQNIQFEPAKRNSEQDAMSTGENSAFRWRKEKDQIRFGPSPFPSLFLVTENNRIPVGSQS
jgi:hypothetical protein